MPWAAIAASTAQLTVRYRRPTPLHRELVLEGTVDRVEGRRSTVHGSIRVDGQVTAEATATFVAPEGTWLNTTNEIVERHVASWSPGSRTSGGETPERTERDDDNPVDEGKGRDPEHSPAVLEH